MNKRKNFYHEPTRTSTNGKKICLKHFLYKYALVYITGIDNEVI